MSQTENRFDVSVILPSMNEGENVRKVIEEVISVLENMKVRYEIIAIDSPSENPSFRVYKEYSQTHENFTAISLLEKRKAGTGKTVQYMIGFKLAKGRYIVHLDTDGQDNFADFPKFWEQLQHGYDLVVGHKQKRKDAKAYMFWSKVGNTLTRKLTGTEVHDMNCGFKAYKGDVARSLNLKGRWYRYIPSILQSKGFKVTEVPIENRKREWGKSNFNFFNRMQAGLFDMLLIAILNRYRDVEIYFWGWVALISTIVSLVIVIVVLLLPVSDLYKTLGFIMGASMFNIGAISFLFGLFSQFSLGRQHTELSEYGISQIVSSVKQQ